MGEQTQIVEVYAGPMLEAQRVHSALMGHGIKATLLDQHLGALGDGFFPVSVVVRVEDLDSARVVLEESGLRAKT